MNNRCFIDTEGQVWTINHEGRSNHPHDIQIAGNTVQILAHGGDGLVVDEYLLWSSLGELAAAIESTNICNVESPNDHLKNAELSNQLEILTKAMLNAEIRESELVNTLQHIRGMSSCYDAWDAIDEVIPYNNALYG